jgi:hypothetical protein
VELFAHRAGNLPELIGPAVEAAGALEVDVHLFRNRLEVRHAKLLMWPFSRLWEKWELLPPDAPRPSLDEILRHVPPDVAVWCDVKGFTSRVPRAIDRIAGDRDALTYSCRSWWVLRWVRRHTTARTMRSVGSPWQRRLIAHTRPLGGDHGIAVHERLLHDDWLERLRRVAPTVIAWGVHDRGRADELLAAGVSGLIIDDLELIRALRGSA